MSNEATEKAVDSLLEKAVSILLSSVLAILCVFLFWAEGILILNMIVSFRRKNRRIISNPILTVPTGLACALIPFIILNFDVVISNSLTFEIFKANVLSSTILSLPITGIISIIVYIIKENLYVKGNYNHEQ